MVTFMRACTDLLCTNVCAFPFRMHRVGWSLLRFSLASNLNRGAPNLNLFALQCFASCAFAWLCPVLFCFLFVAGEVLAATHGCLKLDSLTMDKHFGCKGDRNMSQPKPKCLGEGVLTRSFDKLQNFHFIHLRLLAKVLTLESSSYHLEQWKFDHGFAPLHTSRFKDVVVVSVTNKSCPLGDARSRQFHSAEDAGSAWAHFFCKDPQLKPVVRTCDTWRSRLAKQLSNTVFFVVFDKEQQ